MSIKQLQGYIGKANIADQFDDDTLNAVATRVKAQYDQDLLTMTDWIEAVKNGLDLMRQEYTPKSSPWQGASNYKDPILTEASITFGDRATLELLRNPELVSAEVIGKDEKGEKKERCERITEAMNYQINHDMSDWRDDQERMFYTLPNTGTVFKKTVHDPLEQMSESHIVQFPDFVVNQATKSMDKCRSFSHVLDFSKNEVESKVRSKRWLDIELYKTLETEDQQGDEGSNEEQNVINAIDNDQKFIEQQCFFDLDEDGYEEPYTITIHEKSVKVVRIVARFDEQSIVVEVDNVAVSLPEALKTKAGQEVEEFGGVEAMALVGLNPPEVDADTFELLQINPFQQITKYGFIPSPDGTFLDLGYSHLLGAPTQSINATTNQLTDSGTLSNLGGGYLSKEFRKERGLSRMRPGEWKSTGIPADKLKNGIMPNPSKEPSPTLFQLNEKMESKARRFMAVADMSGQLTAQTAPTTALALIQEGMISTSALFARIIKAQSKEFQVLFRINQRTFDEAKYRMILDNESANASQDFNAEGMDIVPTASAEMSSKMQRIQTATIELEQFGLVLQAGGNPVPILKNFFDSIGSTLVDQIFPEEGAMSPQEKQQLEQMQKAQDLSNQIQQQQLEILAREQDRLDADTSAKIEKTREEMKKFGAEVVEALAKAAKSAEEAETEHLNNQITRYTAGLERQLDGLLAIGANNERSIKESPALRQNPNQLGTV